MSSLPTEEVLVTPVAAAPAPETATENVPIIDPVITEDFNKTATAAKLSGTFNETAGFFKRKFGKFTDNPVLEEAGLEQEFLGKVHKLVGSLRGVREVALTRFNLKRVEAQAVCRKHGGRLIDVATDFVEDMKKAILK
jgi:uncharacterized protein YjbJ (UPF0337 family)